MCYLGQSKAIQNNHVLSWAILFYPKQLWVIPFYPEHSYNILSSPMLFLCDPAQLWVILCYSEHSYTILSNPMVFWAILLFSKQYFAILSNPLCYPMLSSRIQVSISITYTRKSYPIYKYQHIMKSKSQVRLSEWVSDSNSNYMRGSHL